jgi:hypothetical protein
MGQATGVHCNAQGGLTWNTLGGTPHPPASVSGNYLGWAWKWTEHLALEWRLDWGGCLQWSFSGFVLTLSRPGNHSRSSYAVWPTGKLPSSHIKPSRWSTTTNQMHYGRYSAHKWVGQADFTILYSTGEIRHVGHLQDAKIPWLPTKCKFGVCLELGSAAKSEIVRLAPCSGTYSVPHKPIQKKDCGLYDLWCLQSGRWKSRAHH